ncbi:hypothetical protein Bca4012_034844 [Brassica carinata]
METKYEDMLPIMGEKMDVDEFVSELCKGFSLLSDPERDLITAERLRRNSSILGIEVMRKEDAEARLQKETSTEMELLTKPSSAFSRFG